MITRHSPLHALSKLRRRILPIHPTTRPFTAPFSPIYPIKSCSPPHSHRRASSIGDMVGATRSRSYTPDSTTGVEASKCQGRPLVPASPPAADIIVAPPVVEHHSTHQRRDRRGGFATRTRGGGGRRTRAAARWQRNWRCRSSRDPRRMSMAMSKSSMCLLASCHTTPMRSLHFFWLGSIWGFFIC